MGAQISRAEERELRKMIAETPDKKGGFLFKDIMKMPRGTPVKAPAYLSKELEGFGIFDPLKRIYKDIKDRGAAVLTGTNYVGPFNRLDEEYLRTNPPMDKIDEGAMKHDLEYSRIAKLRKAGTPADEIERLIRKSDDEFLDNIKKHWRTNPRAAAMGYAGIKGKNIAEDTVGLDKNLFVGEGIPKGMKLSILHGGAGAKNLNMFELFKGTGSIGKTANRMGFNVVSLDFDPIYTPDIETDILRWDYKKWAEENNFIPDYIWASPPCNTFSTLAYRLKERNTKTAVPKSARAKEGTAILHKTIEIIKYFQRKNPKLLYTIENPRGMMRHDSEIKKLPNRETTLYALYGDFKRKPTDFWSNFPMKLKPHTEKYDKKNVIGNLADLPTIEQRYSIPSKLVKAILLRAKESYGSEPVMKGSGFFGDLWDAAKTTASNVVSSIRNVVSGRAPRENYSPSLRALLAQIGDMPIVEMYVRRDPVQNALNTVLNVISLGKWNEVRQRYAYDKFFHLRLEVFVKVSESSNIIRRYAIEKNEIIEIQTISPPTQDTDFMSVPMNGRGATINSLLEGAKSVLGNQFFVYDAFHMNCQDFVMAMLLGSGFATPELTAFVKQPIDQLITEIPSWTGKIARGLTDAGGVVNTVLYGQGGSTPMKGFREQLQKAGVNPVDYLAMAKKKAKAQGLADNMLGFSSDEKHKLQIPNADGRLIRFGAVGLGDYLIYTLSHDASADKHRKSYLARATKIKGDWKKDPYSANSLAIHILW
jgi:hypothetical protein